MKKNSRTFNSVRNILTGFVGQFIFILAGFINRSIFIKCLSSEYLGVNGLFTNILTMLSLADLGIGTAIVYALYKPLAEDNKIEISKLMNFYKKAYSSIGIVIFILGLGLIPFLDSMIGSAPNIQESIYVIYLIYLFNTSITYFASYKSSLIIADQKNYISTLITYGVYFLQTLIQIIVLFITKNFIAYLIVQSICAILQNIIITIVADKMYPYLRDNKNLHISKKVRKNLIADVRALVLVKLGSVLVTNTDNIIITYVSGLSIVGLLSNYTMLVNAINRVLQQLFTGITASIGNLNAKESRKKKEQMFEIVNFCNFWLFGFSAICIILLINDVIHVWIGPQYQLDESISIMLAINFYMVGMQNAVWTYKNTLGIFQKGRYLLLLTAAINLILSVILGKTIGLFGILLSTAIARICTNTWYDPYIVYRIGFKKGCKRYFFKYIKYIVVLIIAGLPTYLLCNLINFTPFITLLLKLIICLIVPNIIIMAFFIKTKEMKYLLRILITLIESISKKVKKRK
ncbi:MULTISPECIES: lipopolysaccharide biosynthesis protein [unclassified Romboutsia]|uniref:lipopolysaccharide biosynthesis protein n=1 Tax=unclassified Romboutsia TaxID=2626894 RepID=UPI000820EA61|nr:MULTISPECIES: oligosaccharide flippase family protein [unclassified Romboutsia]SCH62539.1 Polysaccharide biosynthesis protein [uncultured Clostridium sp.]